VVFSLRFHLRLLICPDQTIERKAVHVFVIAGLRVLFKAIGTGASPLTGAIFIIISLLLSAAVGLVVFALFERPAVRWAKRLLRV